MTAQKITSCTNCQAPVKVRRPSATGHHYCTRPECRAAKQRYYRGRQVEQVKQAQQTEIVQLVHDLLNVERRHCDGCGLEDALPGWTHRDASGMRPCTFLGNKGRDVGLPALDQIHPERVPA